jgi:hypothetical protein
LNEFWGRIHEEPDFMRVRSAVLFVFDRMCLVQPAVSYFRRSFKNYRQDAQAAAGGFLAGTVERIALRGRRQYV